MKLELVNLKTAAKELDCGQQFLRQLAREGKVPCYLLSQRKLRFDLAELRDCMKKNAQQRARTTDAA